MIGENMEMTFNPKDILPDGEDFTVAVNPFTGFREKLVKEQLQQHYTILLN